jgi:cholest-4-en-3-one 26-monooxygenase
MMRVTISSQRQITSLDQIDLTDYELYRQGFPHEIFSYLRQEAPVWRHPETPGIERIDGSFWVLSRFDDVRAVNRDHGRFRSLEGPSLRGEPPERRGLMIVSMDPPDHTRLRSLVNKGFTPRMTAKLDGQARAWAGKIVESALERETCNFVHEVAYQLPMHMIADIVGIPERDRAMVFELVDKLLLATDPRSAMTEAELNDAQGAMFSYAHELGEEKRRNPVDDIWTKLTQAALVQEDGTTTQLNEFELDLFFMVLTVAGSETTRSAIAAGLVALLEHPDQLERMRREPEVIDTAVEEILRWSSPLSYFARTAVEDSVVGGVEIKAGDRLAMYYPSANRDEEVFEDPFRFDVARSGAAAQVAFGAGGIHYCLGANLAKREIKVMFQELLARVGEIELLGSPEYSVQGLENPITVSLKSVPVRLSAL